MRRTTERVALLKNSDKQFAAADQEKSDNVTSDKHEVMIPIEEAPNDQKEATSYCDILRKIICPEVTCCSLFFRGIVPLSLSVTANISSIYFLNELISNIAKNENTDNLEFLPILWYLLVLLAGSFFKHLKKYLMNNIEAEVSSAIQNRLIKYILSLSLLFYQKISLEYNPINLLEGVGGTRENYFILIEIFIKCIQVIAVAIYACVLSFSVPILLAFIVPVPLYTAYIWYAAKKIVSAHDELLAYEQMHMPRIYETMNYHKSIKICNAENIESHVSSHINATRRELLCKANNAEQKMSILHDLITYLARSGLIFATAMLVVNKSYGFITKDFLAIHVFYTLFIEPLNEMVTGFAHIMKSIVPVFRCVYDILQTQTETESTNRLKKAPILLATDGIPKGIIFDHVSFTYETKLPDCDLIYLPSFSQEDPLNNLPSNNNFAYVRSSAGIFFADQNKKTCIKIMTTPEQEQNFDQELHVQQFKKYNYKVLTKKELKIIAAMLNHTYYEPTYVFKDLSFKIFPGETIAIIGESGIGKSTILDLMLGLYHPAQGTIRIIDYHTNLEKYLMDFTRLKQLMDQQTLEDIEDIAERKTLENLFPNLQDIASANLRRVIACIEQKTSIFSHDSLLLNAAYPNRDPAIQKVAETFSKVGLTEMITHLTSSQDNQEAPQISNLSMGQNQRLGLCRAMLGEQKSIYLFDEITASLDSEIEFETLKLISQLTQDKTRIFISHRLLPFLGADKILFLYKSKDVSGHVTTKCVMDTPQKFLPNFFRVSAQTINDQDEGYVAFRRLFELQFSYHCYTPLWKKNHRLFEEEPVATAKI